MVYQCSTVRLWMEQDIHCPMKEFAQITSDIDAARAAGNAEALQDLIQEASAFSTREAAAVVEHATGAYLRLQGEFLASKTHFLQALQIYEELGNTKRLAEIRYAIGWVELNEGNATTSIEHFRLAIELYEIQDDVAGSIGAITGLGHAYRVLDDYPRALSYYHQAADLQDTVGDKDGRTVLVSSLGHTYLAIHDYAKAVEHYQHALKLSEESGRVPAIIEALNGMGAALAASGELNEAIEYLDRAKALCIEKKEKMHLAAVLEAEIDVHLAREDQDTARSIMTEQEVLIEQFPDMRTTYYTQVGQYYELIGDLSAAKEWYQKSLDLAEADGNRSRATSVHLRLRDLAEREKNFQSYVHHNTTYLRLAEEISGKGATQKMAILEADRRMESERRSRDKERALLYGTLPRGIADRMIRGERVNDLYNDAVVLFADIVNFTTMSSTMSPAEVAFLLESLFRRFDEICNAHSVVKVKTIGDLCFKGDGTAAENALAVARVARDMQATDQVWKNGDSLSFRIGIHAGPITAGVIGTERIQYDVWGDAVNTASRLESTGQPDRIHVSESFVTALHGAQQTDADAVNPPWSLTSRGETELKGKGRMTTYWLS
jgi:adenylate cyclase